MDIPVSHDKSDREKLGRQLERSASKLEGQKRDHFVDSRSLCNTCRWATIKRRASQNNRLIRCSEIGEYVHEDITECSAYQNITTLSLSQMAEIATLIDPRNHEAGYL